ncbi:MAG: hypothetical protein CMJ75_19040 [Planctomycetaceae bacterium]|nr:hypothetical protein [Planctomycetaceae bacterium]
MNIQALEQDVQSARDAYELELLFAGFDENAPEVVGMYRKLAAVESQLNRAKGEARNERNREEACHAAADDIIAAFDAAVMAEDLDEMERIVASVEASNNLELQRAVLAKLEA